MTVATNPIASYVTDHNIGDQLIRLIELLDDTGFQNTLAASMRVESVDPGPFFDVDVRRYPATFIYPFARSLRLSAVHHSTRCSTEVIRLGLDANGVIEAISRFPREFIFFLKCFALLDDNQLPLSRKHRDALQLILVDLIRRA